MHEWIHICNDVDNEQDVEKDIKTFLQYANEAFCQNFELLVTQEWVHTCSDLDSGHLEHIHMSANAKFIVLVTRTTYYACMDTCVVMLIIYKL